MLRWMKANKPLLRFGKARRGMAALEFALVLPWFFLLTFGLAEIAMIGFAQTTLDYGVSETARQIRTGQAQLSGMSGAQIKADICSNLNQFMVMDCDANLYVDIDRFSSFVDAESGQNANPLSGGAFTPTGMGYQPGAPSDIVVVRTYYRWQVMTPLFEAFFSNAGSGQRILVSTMMFRNEPYCTGACPT